jgi:murein DD-endopeptidase MepM/ murein hydrolase activator NlpD
VPIHTRYVLAPVILSLGLVGCVGDAATDRQSQSSTASAAGDGQSLPPSLPPASPNAYRLPWTCGHVFAVNQGNNGDLCGRLGNHLGVEEFAWDFGLPMRTPVVAARAGKVTLAETPSPPGSACYDGCPGTGGADLEQQACCSACLYSANKVNVQHSDGVISSYSHLDQVIVTVGQVVAAGDLLGYSGTTGCSTGPHLHFQIMFGCPTGYCQSLPMTFDDAGVPACGDKAISQNACL